jgi:hypothetical protein
MGKMRGRSTIAIAMLSGWVAVLLLSGSAAQAESAEVVEAVWKPQRINFVYHGYSTLYSCSGLQHKLEKILATVGARDHVELRAYSCNDAASIASFQIVLASPVAATPENLRELTTYDARDELLAHVRGERLASTEDVPRFPAVWKTISFARSREMRLDPGDCELVQQLRRHVLPRMSVQIVSDRVRCSAFGNYVRPQLTVAALVPVETAKVSD